jgi:regulator of protease activity HflC (stomatin/prohibitin superfamily)
MFKNVFVRASEMGLRFVRAEFAGLVAPGSHWFFDPLGRVSVTVVSRREPFLTHPQLDLIIKSGLLAGHAEVLDVQDQQRALVWLDGRFSTILAPGLYAYWTGFRRVRVEMVNLDDVRCTHRDLEAILRFNRVSEFLSVEEVPAEHVGVLRIGGRYVEPLPPGKHAFWKTSRTVKVTLLDRKEIMQDLAGQELLTADKVTLRMNIVVVYRVQDAVKVTETTDALATVMHRETQLALRTAVGVRELDNLLAEKDVLAQELTATVRQRAQSWGVEVIQVGLRDIILPGDMRTLLNQVIQARKAAEAGVITRREEAAMLRHQANAAKLLAEQPLLMRLRELETIEKIAATGKLKVVLGEKGLTERVAGLL